MKETADANAAPQAAADQDTVAGAPALPGPMIQQPFFNVKELREHLLFHSAGYASAPGSKTRVNTKDVDAAIPVAAYLVVMCTAEETARRVLADASNLASVPDIYQRAIHDHEIAEMQAAMEG